MDGEERERVTEKERERDKEKGIELIPLKEKGN